MKSLAPWGLLPLLAFPLDSWALSLGEIETHSYLNQPLNAEIPLSATAEELQGLSVSLGPIDEFTRRDFDYPAVLRTVEVQVTRNAAGDNVIRITSTRSVNETFLDLIIHVDYRSGALIREYTLLLDPPVFMPAEAAAEPIAAPATREPAPQAGRGAVVREQPPSAPRTSAPAPAAPQRTAQAPVAPAPATTPGGDYTVQGGDTLWGIAERSRPNGVSNNQAMISIYEANRSAFGGNINSLRRGAILRIPPASELGSVSATVANAEVRRQTEDWQAGVESEQRLILRTPGEDDETPAVAAGAADAGAAPTAELEDEIAGLEDELASTRAELDETRRLLELQSAELAELQSNVAANAAATEAVFEDEVSTSAAEATPAEAPAEQTVVEEEPAASPEPDAGPTLVERVIALATNPIVWFVAAAALILLLAVAFLRRRQDSDADEITGQWEALDEDIGQDAAHIETTQIRAPDSDGDMVVVEGSAAGGQEQAREEPVFDINSIDEIDEGSAADDGGAGTMEFEALDPGDISDIEATDEIGSSTINELSAMAEDELSDDTLSSQTVINLDQVDPVAEADFHMAYGLYDQAADLLNQSLATDPDNRELKLKLLEVYFVWGNKESFLGQARSFRDEVGEAADADWDKVVIMGKQICPDDELFADGTSMTAITESVDLDLESSAGGPGLDFTLEEDADDAVDLELDDSEKDAEEPDTLEIGAQTEAGLAEALFFEDDEEQAPDPDSTMDTPTVEIGAAEEAEDTVEADLGDLTQESPTLNTPASDGQTIETPTIEVPVPGSGDTVEQPQPEASGSSVDLTAELALDDLGLDVGDIENLPADDELSATGVTQALDTEEFDPEQDGTAVFAIEPDSDAGDESTGATEVLERQASEFIPDESDSEDDLDLNLDEFSSALEGGDTVEQPGPTQFGDVDLDIGADVLADDEPTGTEEAGELDPEAMSEVGTKLDLARAYVDMGDPEGARSILEEVLTEGDSGQRSEAKALIDKLPGT